jgi:hypothetical protein
MFLPRAGLGLLSFYLCLQHYGILDTSRIMDVFTIPGLFVEMEV